MGMGRGSTYGWGVGVGEGWWEWEGGFCSDGGRSPCGRCRLQELRCDFHNHHLIFTSIFDNEWSGNWNVLLLARDPSRRCILAIFILYVHFSFFLIFTFTAANYMRQLLERTYLSYFFIFDGVFGPTRVSFSGCFGPLWAKWPNSPPL